MLAKQGNTYLVWIYHTHPNLPDDNLLSLLADMVYLMAQRAEDPRIGPNRGSTKNFLKRKKFLLHLCVLFSYCFLQLSVASQLSAGVKMYDQRGILKTEVRISHSGDRSEGSASALTVLPGIQLSLHLTFVSI